MLSLSPLYTLQRSYQSHQRSAFINSYFSHSFSSVIYSNSNKHQTILHGDVFSHIMNCAIFLKSESSEKNEDCFFVYPNNDDVTKDKFFEKGDLIHDITVNADQYKRNTQGTDNFRPYFRKNDGNTICGDITITKCIFEHCHADSYSGGSLHIEQDSSVLIHSTIFSDSYTKRRFGGACVICKTITDEDSDFKTEKLQKLDIQYCCFQNCYGNDDNYPVYGVAIFAAAQKTMLYYASTVNCPGMNGNQAKGAQFDLNAPDVTSHSVNSTGGKSEFCSGIEYRNTNTGFFKFQSISDSECKFAIAYTDVSGTTTNDLNLAYSNIFNIKLSNIQSDDNVYPGLIHVRRTNEAASQEYSFKVNNFCFIKNGDFSEANQRIISKGSNGVTVQKITVILEHCTFDCGNDKIAYIPEGQDVDSLVSTINCNLGGDPTLNIVSQLSLGDCEGEVPPEPLTPIAPTLNFSESFEFTVSAFFSDSDGFSQSKNLKTPTLKFSESFKFTASAFFSDSDGFSQSKNLKTPTKTSCFSQSNKFSKSSEFSSSKQFTYSKEFTQSEIPQPIPPAAKKGGNKSTGMIAGVTVAAVAAVAIIAALVAFFMWKKKHMNFEENSANVVDGQESVVSVDNNLNTVMEEDDPFAGDFTIEN